MNRIEQFFINITDKMDINDYNYAKKYLSDQEYSYFIKLSKSEQKHSVRVARTMEKVAREGSFDKNIYIRLGLLHDIGKGERSPNVFEKSIIVILNAITRGKIKRWQKIKVIDIYYNHPKKSADILRKLALDNDFIYIIKNHHNKNAKNIHVNNLISCDDDN